MLASMLGKYVERVQQDWEAAQLRVELYRSRPAEAGVLDELFEAYFQAARLSRRFRLLTEERDAVTLEDGTVFADALTHALVVARNECERRGIRLSLEPASVGPRGVGKVPASVLADVAATVVEDAIGAGAREIAVAVSANAHEISCVVETDVGVSQTDLFVVCVRERLEGTAPGLGVEVAERTGGIRVSLRLACGARGMREGGGTRRWVFPVPTGG